MIQFVDWTFFIGGYVVSRFLLFLVPTVTMFPFPSITYRDDLGVCYRYQKEYVPCRNDEE